MALLLIGSTGNGKSTFGNFLLDPSDDHLFSKQTFKTAQSNLPETQNVKSHTKIVKFNSLKPVEVSEIINDQRPDEQRLVKTEQPKVVESNSKMGAELQPTQQPSKQEADEAKGKELKVATAESRQLFTKVTKEMSITVIDTPGLNENAAKDLKHMVSIVGHLKKLESVKACVFVVKFNSKIDAQYKATVEYYSRLLPSFFERNVIVVMTDFAKDTRSVEMRKRQKINVDEVVNNVRKEIVTSGGLSCDPMIFLVDCLPIGDDEEKFSMDTRDAFFQYIDYLQPFNPVDFMVAKTHYLQMKDREKVRKYEGEITGYNVRLKEANEKAKESLDIMEAKEAEITESSTKISTLTRQIESKDNDKDAVAAAWNLEQEWKLFRTQECEYNVTSKWKKHAVKRWTNGKCTWHDEEETEHGIKGKVKGKFMRGLYARLTLMTTMAEKYAPEIAQLKEDLTAACRKDQALRKQLQALNKKHEEHKHELKLLQDFIEMRRADITVLSNSHLTIKEAMTRLHEVTELSKELLF